MPPFSIEATFNAFLALMAITDPIAVVPLYAELGKDLAAAERRRVYSISVITAFATLGILMATGQWVMAVVFQIHVAEFRLAGGILLLVIAVKNIAFYHPDEFKAHPEKILEMSIVPMAIPLLIGPGAIVTGILILARDGWIVAFIALGLNFVLSWLVIVNSITISKAMGPLGTLVLSKILWIFIAAIGAHFLLSGLSEVFGIPLFPAAAAVSAPPAPSSVPIPLASPSP